MHDQGGQSPYFFGPKPGRQGHISDKVTGNPARSPPQTHTQPQQTFSRGTFPDDFMRILSLDVKIVEPKTFKEGSPEHAYPPGINHGNGEIL